MSRALFSILVYFLAACTQTATRRDTSPPAVSNPSTFPATQPVRARSIDQAIADGVAFLVKSQNEDGSWGTGLETRGWEVYSKVPGSHDAFRVATTALCV